MFVDRLQSVYGKNKPIFTDEILKSFAEYSSAWVFRSINEAEDAEKLKKLAQGVYCIPETTRFGEICPTAYDIASKRYIEANGEIFGVLCGLALQNAMAVTMQVPAVTEIVSNREKSRKRCIEICGRQFVVRRSRCEINERNVRAYAILQLLGDLKKNERLDDLARKRIVEYLKEGDIGAEQLVDMSRKFPARVAKRLLTDGVLDAIA